MSNPAKPGWPDASALPFTFFGAGAPAASAAAQPLAQGLAGGVDLIRKFWGNLPGGSALPGFMVPTVDLEELDKRIADLRAAESWLDVNMNMLRATIQGLEVQRHTIAAIQSLSAMGDVKAANAPAVGGLPSGWPMSAATQAAPQPAPAPAPEVAPPAPAEVAPEPPAEASTPSEQPAAPADGASSDATASPPNLLAGLAASNWLGFMQDQFSKVAQAALSTSPMRAAAAAGTGAGQAARPPRKTAKKAASKKARARRPAAHKRSDA